jgi:glycosyltransferase involved in cell wall biosynthesis
MDGPTAVFVGRLVLQKNLPLLVEAVAEVPGFRVVVVGDGPEHAALEAAVTARGLEDRVRLVPAVPRAAAMRWMKAADVTVLPSSWENHPHAVVESLTVGTPVVATAVGGVPEIVTDGVDGLLTPDGDAAALADALRAALLDAGRSADLRRGAADVGDRFAPERSFARAAEIIEQASRARAARAPA